MEETSNSFEGVYPKLKFGWEFESKRTTSDGQEIEIPIELMPAFHRIGETSLSVLLVRDKNQMVEWLKNKELNDLNIESALQTAFQNLFSDYTELGIGEVNTQSEEIQKVGMLMNMGIYCGSLIMIGQIWDKIYDFIGSDSAHFIVPNSRTFMFCDASNPKATAFLYGNAKHQSLNSPDKISEFVYHRKKGESIVELEDSEIALEL